MNEADLIHAILRGADTTVHRARWLILEEAALSRLAGRPGLTRTPLWPPSLVIQIVAHDGEYVGRVRLENPREQPERWLPVPPGRWVRPSGPYPSAEAAANALHALRRG